MLTSEGRQRLDAVTDVDGDALKPFGNPAGAYNDNTSSAFDAAGNLILPMDWVGRTIWDSITGDLVDRVAMVSTT